MEKEEGGRRWNSIHRPVYPAGRKIGSGTPGEGKAIRATPGMDAVRLVEWRGRTGVFEGISGWLIFLDMISKERMVNVTNGECCSMRINQTIKTRGGSKALPLLQGAGTPSHWGRRWYFK